jgi:4,5-DOPA dioxygenase extradiol
LARHGFRIRPALTRAHPGEDHFLPISRPDYLSREVMYSMLAMDSFALPASAPATRPSG